MISKNAIEDSSALRADFETLFESLGVAASYIDYNGHTVAISLENRLRVLGLLGIEIENESELTTAVQQFHEDKATRFVDSTFTVTQGKAMEITLRVPLEFIHEPLEWSLCFESDESIAGSLTPSELESSSTTQSYDSQLRETIWRLPELPVGYYELKFSSENIRAESLLLVSPQRCFQPPWAEDAAKLAGLSVHLYTLRTEKNWGLGDFGDLKKLLPNCVDHGLDFLVLNPLHILDSKVPENCSPYSPLDRRFINPFYIEIESEADFAESEIARDLVTSKRFEAALADQRDTELVDYVGSYALKQELLIAMFEHFSAVHVASNTSRGRAFSLWLASKSESLLEFCRFEAGRHDGDSGALKNPHYHLYLQWLSETQLAECQRLAKSLGMSIGLIRDLAVGGNAASAEVQLNPTLFSAQASIGSPPDSFAPQGQNWGLPPMKPAAMTETRFSHFRELLRSNMTSCSALRMDHVMTLMRLWWSPAQGSSAEGGYVRYPVDLLFAILRIESVRARCVVIGEDLGVVPPEIREYLDSSGVYGNTLFYFEKYDAQTFKRPEHFRPKVLSMIANHDVPTLRAWWEKADLRLRQELDLYADLQQLSDATAARESDLIQVLHWLDEQSLLPDSWRHFNIHHPFDATLCAAILRGNGGSAAQLVSAQLEDLCGVSLPLNIPGTSSEYPNWRRKLPLSVDEIFADTEISKLLDSFVRARSL